MKPLPFIIMGIYILMFVLAGFIFGAKPVICVLGVMLAIATVLYIAIIIEEKPWKFAFPGESFLAYAILAYGVVLFLLPIIALNIVEELKSDGKITWRWLEGRKSRNFLNWYIWNYRIAFAEFPAMMWVALFLDCLLVLYMLLLGIDGILFPSRMTTLRMVIGGYGVVNTIFLLIAGYVVIGEASPERESCPEDRLERYQNVIAPMLVLFPLLAPMWAGFIATLILTFICGIIYWSYKNLEDKVLK